LQNNKKSILYVIFTKNMTIFEVQLFGITLAPTYYGLMYVFWFIAGYYYVQMRKIISNTQLESLFFYVFFWLFLWGRLGYVLFYQLPFYLENPAKIFAVWEGGMSFHGGFLWVVIAVCIFCWRNRIYFWKIIDELAVIVPIGIGFGRIGNYLNGELFWKHWYSGWFVMRADENGVGNFPSPLVESLWEGFLLCIVLFFVNKYKTFHGVTSIGFLLGYATVRLIVELFWRLPDEHIDYIFTISNFGVSLWALLTLPMFCAAFILYFFLRKHENI